jgi:HSP20 family protein
MFSRLTEFDRTFDVLDELRRQMDRVWNDYEGAWGVTRAPTQALSSTSWPRFNLLDAGANLVVTADVPGISEKDLTVSLEDGVLTVSGERKPLAPEGYAVHRRERAALRFGRSVALPVKIDAEKVSATVKDGVLTITLAKAAEARPRQIAVRAPTSA